MAMLGAGAGQGQTLWMAINARDRTGAAFESVKSKMDKLSSVAITTMGKIGSLSMSFATLGRVTGLLNNEQAKAIGVFGTVMSVMATLATVIQTLTSIKWGQVAAETWYLSLATIGVGVAIAAAAAMAILAMQTQNATESQRAYNTELERGIDAQRRRTANQRLVRRGELEEVLD